MNKEPMHFYKKPITQLATLCGIFVHCVQYIELRKKRGYMQTKQHHTRYPNRVTCKDCLRLLKGIQL